MGSLEHWMDVIVLSLLVLFYHTSTVRGQERDALCNDKGCFMVYFQRKSFLEAWRSCKEKGGNLATVKLQEEADTIAALFSGLELRGARTKVQVWIGLQRQPRQCTASRPLRGFSWTTGDQDTQYTNWLMEDSPSTCSVPRCVAMSYSKAAHEQHNNYKWLDGSCSVPVDGYLCRYTYKGMCPPIWGEGAGNVLYSTPFSLLSTLLTHVPFGSVATVPCPEGTKDEQSVLCMLKEHGTVGWSRDAPLCSDITKISWCDQDNGGCEHFCREIEERYYCECSGGFQLGDDGQTCAPVDVCHGAPCQFECLPLPDGYRCACPEGYMLAPDERGCQDVDECLQSPCEQLCVNTPGSFKCLCHQGYRTGEGGEECEDVDECAEDPCEHACENTPGSHVCHCHLGFSPVPEDPSRCQDTDECQIPDMCEQMCVNYDGSFECYCEVGFKLLNDHYSCGELKDGEEDSTPTATTYYPGVTLHPGLIWESQEPMYHWTSEQTNVDWPTQEEETLGWLTDGPTLASDGIWSTSKPQEESTPNHNPSLVLFTEGGEEDKVEVELIKGWETNRWNVPVNVQPELEPTPTLGSSPSTSPVPTPMSDWYDVEEKEVEEYDTPSSPSVLPTSTISEGAWNQEHITWQELTTEQDVYITNYDVRDDKNEDVGNSDTASVTSPKMLDQNLGVILDHHTPSLPPVAASQTPVSCDHGVVDEEVKDEPGNSNWLLVGLLVPVCFFVVVMVVLGVIYCTRCAAAQRNKTATDCYHWISGAHDKQGAANPCKGTQSHV
ncbi:hypothetical protein DPEC_G00101200 [Dallia pectoralis]|uniref:Uncharacterized protein n=1 Tax=Dallia pectoralis TaxID=75939 RepID=A0ACC2GXF7_DALPE|nr:hypothetical protein DPEC_G00101200 [Dallia pectoralis]